MGASVPQLAAIHNLHALVLCLISKVISYKLAMFAAVLGSLIFRDLTLVFYHVNKST